MTKSYCCKPFAERAACMDFTQGDDGAWSMVIWERLTAMRFCPFCGTATAPLPDITVQVGEPNAWASKNWHQIDLPEGSTFAKHIEWSYDGCAPNTKVEPKA